MERIPKILKRAGRVVAVAIIGISVLFIGYALNHMQGADFVPKTLWDWLDLLIVPAALAVGGVVLNMILRRDEEQRKTEQAKIEQERAEQQAEIERNRLEEQQREQTLQNYLDRMSTLMIDKGLKDSQNDDPVRDMARAITITVLRNLDGSRNAIVTQFLSESGLIHEPQDQFPIISLNRANLAGVDLSRVNLTFANLEGANLESANLEGTGLSGANLYGADLKGAGLSGANLYGANLEGAGLLGANLTGANLEGANLKGANLTGVIGKSNEEIINSGAILDETTIMPNGQKYTRPQQ